LTTETNIRLKRTKETWLATVFCAVAAWACASGNPAFRDGLPPQQVERMPDDIRSAYRLFAARCSRCHTLARPLNSGIIDPRHWRLYVARMRRQTGSGISAGDADRILMFLDYYSKQVRKGRWSGGPMDAVTDFVSGSSTTAEVGGP
jgi:hypothetical protein